MHFPHCLRNGLIFILIVSCCLIGHPQPAHAADLQQFITILRKIEQVTPPHTLPFTADEVEGAKEFLGCMLDAGGDMYDQALCADTFLKTTDEVPDWVPFCLELYILLASHDYYGLAQKLATDPQVACAILSILIPGPPICDLLAELVELAEGLYDVGKVIYEFFGDVLGAAYGAAKDAYCATAGHVLGGCSDDDGPDIPPQIYVYERFFHPRLADGLAARKNADTGALAQLINVISASAATFAKTHQPVGFLNSDAVMAIFCSDPHIVRRAADIFTDTVNTLWTEDLASNVLAARAGQFTAYSNNPAVQNALTAKALQAFSLGTTWSPQQIVVDSCRQTFTVDYGFAHIDYWLQMVSELGPTAQSLKEAVQSNSELCTTYWQLKKADIGEQVFTGVKQDYCGQLGSGVQCNTLNKYRHCLGLLNPFDRKDRCRANTLTTGKEAADEVMAQIMTLGPAHPEKWRKAPPESTGPAATIHSELPFRLIGYRPTHAFFCLRFVDQLFGSLPQQLVECSYEADEDYLRLAADVNNAVEQLNHQYANGFTAGKYWDPLVVEASTGSSLEELKNEDPSFGFGPPSNKSGFNYSPFAPNVGLDGVSTPLIFFDIHGKIAEHINQLHTPVRDIRDMIDPRLGPGGKDPRTTLPQLNAKTQLRQSVKSVQATQLSGSGQQVGQQATGSGQKVMSGTVPAGQQPAKPPAPRVSPKQSQAANVKKAAQVVQTGNPDLVADDMLYINRTRQRFNTTIPLDTAHLKDAGNGRFMVETRLTIRNSGKAPSPPCQVSWPSARKTLPVPALQPGKSHIFTTQLDLAPGTHRLQLLLDPRRQVKEGNEGNNQAIVTITLTTGADNRAQASSTTKRTLSVKPVAPQATRQPLQNRQTTP